MQLCFVSGSVHTYPAPLQIRGEIPTLITATAKAQKGTGPAAFLLVLKQPTSSDFSQSPFLFVSKLKTGKLVHCSPSRLMFIPLPEQAGARPWQTQVCGLILV